jgi:hypothetical protein
LYGCCAFDQDLKSNNRTGTVLSGIAQLCTSAIAAFGRANRPDCAIATRA